MFHWIGTDYPSYFNENPGAVLGVSIDKYIYIIALPMAEFADFKFRVTHRMVEEVDRVEDIKHNGEGLGLSARIADDAASGLSRA
jgi:galactokinase/mevalonate kinase-like predicted kinase